MSHLELPGGKNYQLDGDDGICIGLSKPVEGGAARITFGKDEHVPTKYLRIYRTAGKWVVHRLRGAPAVTVDEKHELSEGSYMPIRDSQYIGIAFSKERKLNMRFRDDVDDEFLDTVMSDGA